MDIEKYLIDHSHILDAIDDAIIGKDLQGTIIIWNKAAEKKYGYSVDEVLGRNIKFIIPADGSDEYDYTIEKVMRGETVYLSETKRIGKNGKHIKVSLSITPVRNSKNKIIGAASIARDVSALKQLSEQLYIKNLELENASLAKDQFLASMSHELRTPLNTIVGFTGALLMRLSGPLTTEQEKQLKIIESGSKMLIYLINDILDLAKIESGNVHINLEKINCNEIVSEVVSTLSILAESKKIELRCSISSDELYVMTDRRSLMQILINLLNNAIKYTEKGYVEIKSHVEKINNVEFVKIDVVDTGVGIKEEYKSRLFRQFERLEAEGKFHDGTGLGLYVSKKLAGLIDAKIEFQSVYGKGSLFSVVMRKL